MPGRKTKCDDDLIAAAWAYAEGGWQDVGDKVPSMAGLACEIGVHRETMRLWSKNEDHPFFAILRVIAEKQERVLLNSGLSGEFNPPITKMMLSKHGYSDRVETDHTSSDGSMTPQDNSAAILAALNRKHADT